MGATARVLFWVSTLIACIGASLLCATLLTELASLTGALATSLQQAHYYVLSCRHSQLLASSFLFFYEPWIYECSYVFEPAGGKGLASAKLVARLLSGVPLRAIPRRGSGELIAIALGKPYEFERKVFTLGVVCVNESEKPVELALRAKCWLVPWRAALQLAMGCFLLVAGAAVARVVKCIESTLGLHWMALAIATLLTLVVASPNHGFTPIVSGAQFDAYVSELDLMTCRNLGALVLPLAVSGACTALAATLVPSRATHVLYLWGSKSLRGSSFLCAYPLAIAVLSAAGLTIGMELAYPSLLATPIGLGALALNEVEALTLALAVCGASALALSVSRNVAVAGVVSVLTAIALSVALTPIAKGVAMDEPFTAVLYTAVLGLKGVAIGLAGAILVATAVALSRVRDL